ncbi:hypothetical protein FH972_014033 [Carpinus fangiana]|uniref:KIB1-4 beta-propeller domain-containing protein n=1 Tax=Carpinus fangiana TaxID=176857 RepID=A0A5N6R8I3_9ROSI|nr:hypothetical protein FH972_014033 [Carpinus fangiana]
MDNLPKDIIQNIANRLTTYSDYKRTREVCKYSWSFIEKIPRHLPPQPWMMILTSQFQLGNQSFFDLSVGRLAVFEPTMNCERNVHVKFSHGEFIIFQKNLDIDVLVVKREGKKESVRTLPSLSKLPTVVTYEPERKDKEYQVRWRADSDETRYLSLSRMGNYIKKIVLAPGKGCLAILNSATGLAVSRFEEKSWTFFSEVVFCWDAIHYKGKFYALNSDLSIFIYDIHSGISSSRSITKPWNVLIDVWARKNLVNSGEDFFLVVCHICPQSFDIFRIDRAIWSWEKVQDLGELSIFIGSKPCDSFCFSHVKGLENCVLYSPGSLHNASIFDLKNKHITKWYKWIKLSNFGM